MRCVVFLFICIWSLFDLQYTFAQGEDNSWYFGSNAALIFRNDQIVIAEGALNTSEGCASVSDMMGNLLFYTDGMKVWNANHVYMPNGQGLSGGYSSSQSALILPSPGENNNYYLFTVDAMAGSSGLSYTVVNMDLDDGWGDVSNKKNVKLKPSICEKITMSPHANGIDIWVIVHEFGTNGFYSFLITSNGVQEAVKSYVGTVHEGVNSESIGCMRISSTYDRLAIAISRQSKIELFDFNNETGELSNPIGLSCLDWSYGVEFSPDGTKLYGSIFNYKIYQWDLNAGNENAIIESRTEVAHVQDAAEAGDIRLGPDGRIYVAKRESSFLGIIQYPNYKGTDCLYLDKGIDLSPAKSEYGLPNINLVSKLRLASH